LKSTTRFRREDKLKSAIITGATGFIGSHLCRFLVDNDWRVLIIARPSSDYAIIGDVADKVEIYEHDGDIANLIRYFSDNAVDVVFHLASLCIIEHEPKDIDGLIECNIRFGLHLLEAMGRSRNKLLINTGTSWQHYNSMEYCPVNLYSATKKAYEDLIRYYSEAQQIRVITLKLFDTYGESDNRPKLINLLHKFADENSMLRLSAGEQFLDLVHVSDVVRAFMAAFALLDSNETITFDEYAVASGREINLKELIGIFESVTNKSVNVCWGGKGYRKREVMKLWNSYRLLPNWECKVSLEEGLKKF